MRRNLLLLFLGDLSMESKDPPMDHHHIHLLFVDGTIFYEYDGILSCGKNWSVLVEDNVLCVMLLFLNYWWSSKYMRGGRKKTYVDSFSQRDFSKT